MSFNEILWEIKKIDVNPDDNWDNIVDKKEQKKLQDELDNLWKLQKEIEELNRFLIKEQNNLTKKQQNSILEVIKKLKDKLFLLNIYNKKNNLLLIKIQAELSDLFSDLSLNLDNRNIALSLNYDKKENFTSEEKKK